MADNDILIKGSAYDLLDPLVAACGGEGAIGVLGSARYVLRDRFDRDTRLRDAEAARARFIAFLVEAVELEPHDGIVALAADLEELAAELNLPFDSGESLLCATAIQHAELNVLTGDKRAIVALERLQSAAPEVSSLAGRISCLEQVITALVDRIGEEVVRDGVCGESAIDRALTICFRCARGEDGHLDAEALPSYIGHLRERAPTMLAASPPIG